MQISRLHLVLALTLLIDSHSYARNNTCCDNAYAYGKTHFSQRPQGNFYPMLMMATADKTHIVDTDKNYQLFSITLGYRQNFDQYYQAQYFLTQNGTVTFGHNNTNVDIRSTDLGLAGGGYTDPAQVGTHDMPTFEGSATACPRIKEFIADFDFYAGFDRWAKGLWFRIHAPVVRTQWNFRLCPATSSPGEGPYPDGFVAPIAAGHIQPPYTDLCQALRGDTEYGQYIKPLDGGKIVGARSRTGVADVHFELGWDFYRSTRGNVGIALIATAPTGLPKACDCANQYLFAPSIGAQRSAQLGGALRGQCDFYVHEKSKITGYFDARAEHLFNGMNKRLLGLIANNTTAFNHYMLLYTYQADGTPSPTNAVVPAANILLRKVRVSAAAMGELTAMFEYARPRWQGGLGYNFWFRTCEHLCPCTLGLDPASTGIQSSYYTAKADSYVGFAGAYAIADTNISQSGTRFGGGIDTPQLVAQNSVKSSDITCSVAQHPATYSNTLFGYLGYTFENRHEPYLAAGAHVEFGRGNTALNMWAFYFKGGITF